MSFLIGDKVKLDPFSVHFNNMLKYGYSAYVTYTVIDTAANSIKIDVSPGWFFDTSFRPVKDIDYGAINKEFA